MKNKIWPITSSGVIKLEKAIPRQNYKKIISGICKQILKNFNDAVYAIYIRGSVALGNNIDGVSDLDMIILLNGPPSKFKTEIDSLESLYRLPDGVFSEISFQYFDKNYFFSRDLTFFSKFVLKTQSICIYGTDVSKNFDEIKLDSKVYGLDIEYFDTKLSKIQKQLNNISSNYSPRVSSICRHASKFIIRTVFAMFAEKKGIYTRDIVFCYHFITCESKFWSKQLKKIYTWVIKPTNNRSELKKELDRIVPLVSSDCDRWIKEKEAHNE